MGRSHKSNRVTWASDVNLCQVRLFLSEDSPSVVGSGTQDHLQAKASWAEQQSGAAGSSDDNLPPGFEGIQPSNSWRVNLSQIPLFQWKCPPRFQVNSEWRVVAGEESSEMEAQNERELRVLEAIYPRPSAIPPNSASSVDNSIHDDQNTPVVPVTPIEDEDPVLDASTSANNNPMISQPIVTFSSAGNAPPNIAAAAQAAFSAIMSSSSDSGNNLIDRDLLVKILSDPKMVEQLVKNHAPSSTTQNMLSSNVPTNVHSVPSSMHNVLSSMHNVPLSMHTVSHSASQARPSQNNPPSTSTQYSSIPKISFGMVNITRPEMVKPSISMTPVPFYPPSTIRPIPPPPSPSSTGVTVKKDINYYKSLIQQHGAEKREILPQFGHHQSNQLSGNSQEPGSITQSTRDQKSKIMKPCIYFNTSRGCRNGANCLYQHDSSSQQRVSGIPDVQNSKRVKLDREITGR